MAMTIESYLKSQNVSEETIKRIIEFRKQYKVTDTERVPKPLLPFVGSQVLNVCINALLQGYHIILEGEKGVGKNTLVDTLAFIFRRPLYSYPFNSGTDSASIIGEDTLSVDENGNTVVKFKPHQLLQAMQHPEGAWFCGDEINMTRAEVLAVLHMVTDYRKGLDIPGYGMVNANPAFRFIGTMNYGYMGTAELNEAFADRFIIVHVSPMEEEDFIRAIRSVYPDIVPDIAKRLIKLFTDLNEKAKSGTFTSRAVSIRGLYQTIGLVKSGVDPLYALECSITNKAFDGFERKQVSDVINTLFTGKETWFITINNINKEKLTSASASLKKEL